MIQHCRDVNQALRAEADRQKNRGEALSPLMRAAACATEFDAVQRRAAWKGYKKKRV
jgi:hypothetical protein